MFDSVYCLLTSESAPGTNGTSVKRKLILYQFLWGWTWIVRFSASIVTAPECTIFGGVDSGLSFINMQWYTISVYTVKYPSDRPIRLCDS